MWQFMISPWRVRLTSPAGALALVLVLTLALILITAITGCDAPSAADPARITATPGAAGPINPLTGLPVRDPAALARRPLAAKISNAPDSVRPQAGIAQADLVFEHYVEGNQTRFTAIFWTHAPPRVGSIRSARLLDLEIPAMYDTLLVYSGASEGVKARIAALPFAPRAYEGVSTGAPLYFRDPGVEVPHNLFAIPAEVWHRASADNLNDPPADLSGMLFDPAPPVLDSAPAPGTPAPVAPAERVTIDYGPDVVQWTYDADTGHYARRVDGEPHTDANTGAQVTAANVVILYAHHQPDLSIVESEWQGVQYFSTEIQLWTLGPAVIIRDGRSVTGYWMRWDEDALLTFWADEAARHMLALKPGNTWFQVVPLDFTGVRIE